MRKLLLFILTALLILLIVTCVYRKTPALYAMNGEKEEYKSPVVQSKNRGTADKKDNVADIGKKSVPKKQESVQLTTSPKKSGETTQHAKELLRVKKDAVTKPVVPEKQAVPEKRVSPAKKIISHTPEVSKKEMQKVENDAVGYLLTVHKEENDALRDRDEAESRLHALIKKVLEERKKAIVSMEEVVSSSADAHEKRMKKRDQSLKPSKQNHTKGE